ncbi:hypothetical protein [Undibacterium danionis]|uniref:Uncharacterized protein n=1 Tax=Undibacterium danionis TaxID=1812100 RepID=A0ABV6IAU0_9BURK
MKDYFLYGSLILNVILAYIVWVDRFKFRGVIAEYDKRLLEEENDSRDRINKAAYNPREFRE